MAWENGKRKNQLQHSSLSLSLSLAQSVDRSKAVGKWEGLLKVVGGGGGRAHNIKLLKIERNPNLIQAAGGEFGVQYEVYDCPS